MHKISCPKCHTSLITSGGLSIHEHAPQKESDEAFCQRTELQHLRDWKASALQVEGQWDSHYIGRLLGAQPGENVRTVIMREVPKLVARNQALEQGLNVIGALMKLV